MKATLRNTLVYLVMVTMVASLALISSCKDDEPGPSIIGTWILTKEETTNCTDPADNSSETYTCTSSNCFKITITDDKVSFTETDGGVTVSVEGTYTINGNQITTCFDFGGGQECDTATWSISGNTLTVTFDDSDCKEVSTFTRQ